MNSSAGLDPLGGPDLGDALVDTIAAEIRSRIMSGEFPIGAQLRQAELAKAFGVSRTPVREALRQLQSGGLIEVHRNRGAVVRVPAPWEVREAYEVRAELEGLAAARAVNRLSRNELATLREANELMYERSKAGADQGDGAGSGAVGGDDGGSGEADSSIGGQQGNDLFHTLICQASDNARLTKVINDINQTFPRNVTALLLVNDARHRDKNYEEHNEIIAALENGDAEQAREAMRSHVLAAGEHLAHWYEQRSATVFLG